MMRRHLTGTPSCAQPKLELLTVTTIGKSSGAADLQFETDDGAAAAGCTPLRRAVWESLGVRRGRRNGRAGGGVYETARAPAQQRRFASLQLDYHRPGDLDACTLDALMASNISRRAAIIASFWPDIHSAAQ